MPTPPLPDDVLIRALQAVETHGTKAAAARALGIPENTLRGQYQSAIRRGLNASPGLREAVGRVNGDMQEARLAWRHDYDDDGRKVGTVLLKRVETPPEEYHARLRECFSEPLPAAPVVSPPQMVEADLCSVHVLADVHLAMHAWPDETGHDGYSLKEAVRDLHTASAKIDAMTPASHRAVLLILGDFFHGDDETNQTFKSKHNLDVDGRYWKVMRAGCDVIERRIAALLARHQEVVVRVMRGNHDPHAHFALSLALESRFRENPRVTIEDPARDIFWHQWGRCMIAGHHGDTIPPQRLYQLLADQCPFWSGTYHRHCFVGHGHHKATHDMGGLAWEMLQPFCPPDAHAARMGYSQRRALHSITFHKRSGLVVRAQDPIERGN